MTSTVALAGIHVRFGRTVALDDVSVQLERGVTGLLGPNGAGKTTLLRVLATALAPDSGTVRAFGTDAGDSAGRLALRRRLGYAPQEPGLHPRFTAFEFVDYVAILCEQVDRRARHAEVRRVLHEVGLDDRRSARIKTLSGGMRRRVALAAALIGNPDLLVLDEPTVGLDPEQRLRFRELIASLGQQRTVLLSTHQTEDVQALCNRVVVMHGGRVRFDGTPAGLVEVAQGRVWTSTRPPVAALASWQTGTGVFRNVGSAPAEADLVEPTLEDGYLLLLDGAPAAGVTA
ncbi:ABC-2 type transport system ATP-binding protein [Kribbella amoyensis]|uniref:ABC-2 type transport system ATP-binding protein n=1 Tax=Kribbella amoyensis TaxID=996641 RepID=A0A561BPK5_9ACTN|nr:ABC transporter ATP-binding protein [Kribbella amoyensis]TWD80808.1 ABC-2 type transport system ATP-binding protein [Kribbella amoyensis]